MPEGDDVPGAEAADLREFFEERAAVLEHDAGLTRAEAEVEAARITACDARLRWLGDRHRQRGRGHGQ